MRSAFYFLLTLVFVSCGTKYKLKEFQYPTPVDTNDKPVFFQQKKVYDFGTVKFDNQFNGARLNDVMQRDDSTYVLLISPENTPINPSSYYGFRYWSDDIDTIKVILKYEDFRHRYRPKMSIDRKTWSYLPEELITFNIDSTEVNLRLKASPTKTYLCGQELWTSEDVDRWCSLLAQKTEVRYDKIGKSREGRDIPYLDVYDGSQDDKDLIVLIGRQHPPEVSGHMAMNAFVEELLMDSHLGRHTLSKYRFLIYPLMNPDGVDLGHWRHNTGGTDMNRDWSHYRQAEVRQVVEHIVAQQKAVKKDVLLGIDFHSTHHDVYYTVPDKNEHIPGFKDYWIEAIDQVLVDGDLAKDSPYKLDKPISKGWFFKQFGAEGITYEVGDETDRSYIKEKAQVAAREMMKLLAYKQ